MYGRLLHHAAAYAFDLVLEFQFPCASAMVGPWRQPERRGCSRFPVLHFGCYAAKFPVDGDGRSRQVLSRLLGSYGQAAARVKQRQTEHRSTTDRPC